MSDKQQNNNLEKCPYCAEEIKKDAEKCKHCNEFINRNLKVEEKLNVSKKEITKEGKQKSNKKRSIWIIVVIFFLLIIFVCCLFLVDVGINSKYFIKRDFNNALEYRMTGDCAKFIEYLERDVDKWEDRCNKEKLIEKPPIRYYKVQNISHEIGSDRAFLQAELTRTSVETGDDHTYSVSYEMKKDGLMWKIDQEIKDQ